MDKDWWRAVAKISVPIDGGEELGTGCLVDDDRVLTSHHTVRWWKKSGGPILVVFADENGSPLADPLEAEVLWTPEKAERAVYRTLDVAVLKLAAPPKVEGLRPPRVPFMRVVSEDWISRGFPKDSSKGPTQQGRTLPERGARLELDVSAPPQNSVVWKGWSGAPVVVGSSVVGVVRERVPGQSARIEAVALSVLREDRGFRTAAGLSDERRRIRDEWDQCHERLLLRAVAALEKSKALRTELCRVLEVDAQKSASGSIVNCALNRWTPTGAVKVHLDVKHGLKQSNAAPEDYAALRDLLEAFLPLIVEQEFDQPKAKKATEIAGAEAYWSGASTSVLAEIYRARREGRPCEFAFEKTELVPEKALRIVLEQETDVTAATDARRFVLEAGERLGVVVADRKALLRADAAAWERFRDRVRPKVAAAREDPHRVCPYLLVRPPNDRKSERQFRNAVALILAELPEMPLEILDPYDYREQASFGEHLGTIFSDPLRPDRSAP